MEHVPGFHALFARARAGDRAATDDLLALIRPWLEQLAQRHAPHGPDGSVSDLVQEAWLRAWQKLDQFQGVADEAQALAMFHAWLARIVSRLGLNAARDEAAQQRIPPGKLLRLNGQGVSASGDSAPLLDPSADEPTPSATVQAEERARLVHEALTRLTNPLDRDIVRLRFFEGLSLRGVAARLGCNPETVRQRYHAVLHQLQRDLHGLL
ncbi:MAG TPA: sigma-70 family RNA polymerase sigma factor [Gemmataceae bacterium]|nr:sigma-70 family RNA polymerase sigma factor [Gemmataceae bacterium]